jgi:hypothetical protein
MAVDPDERLALLEAQMRELEGLIQGCRNDIRVLMVGLVVVFLVCSRIGQAVLALLGFKMFE